MKKLLFIPLLLLVLLFCAGASAEEPHEHDWAVQHNGDYHWIRCRICGEETEKEPHFVLCNDENPTECFACGMTKSQGANLDTVMHYVPDDAVDHNELFHWHYCLLCGAIADIGLHESSCLSPETCTVCWATVEEGAVIPYTPHTWSLAWDQNGHFEQCSSCGRCNQVCPMGLDVKQMTASGTHGVCTECIQCGACVDECPKKVLKYKMWRR